MVSVCNSLMIYDMYMTVKFSEYLYDFEGKGEGQIYLTSVLWIVTQIDYLVIDS